MPVHNQKKIYNELKKHLEVKEQKHLMFPLRDSVEAKKILTKSHEQKRWFTSKPRSTRKLSKEIQKDAKIYANFEIEKNKFVLSPNSSYGQLNPKKSSNFKRSVRSGDQSSKNKIKSAKQRKAKDNLKDTIRLTTPKATKMLKITKLKRSKTSSSQIPINYDNNINSCKISPKYKANVDKEMPGEVYDDSIYMSQRVIDSNGQYIKTNGIERKEIASTVNKLNDNSGIEDTEIDNYEHKEDQDNSKHDRSRSNKRVLISKKKAHGTPKLYSYVNLETKDNLDDPLSNLMEVDQKDKKERIKKLKGRNDKRTQSVRKILPLSSRILNQANSFTNSGLIQNMPVTQKTRRQVQITNSGLKNSSTRNSNENKEELTDKINPLPSESPKNLESFKFDAEKHRTNIDITEAHFKNRFGPIAEVVGESSKSNIK